MLARLAFRGEKGAKRGLDTKTQTKRDCKGSVETIARHNTNAKTLHGGLIPCSPRNATCQLRAIIVQFSEMKNSSTRWKRLGNKETSGQLCTKLSQPAVNLAMFQRANENLSRIQFWYHGINNYGATCVGFEKRI